MLRHDTGRDDNPAGSGGHNMYLTLTTNDKAYNTQIQTDPPMLRTLTAPHYLRKKYVSKKDLVENVGEAFGYEEFSVIKLIGCINFDFIKNKINFHQLHQTHMSGPGLNTYILYIFG